MALGRRHSRNPSSSPGPMTGMLSPRRHLTRASRAALPSPRIINPLESSLPSRSAQNCCTACSTLPASEVETSFADRLPCRRHHALLVVVETHMVDASQQRLVATQFEPGGMVVVSCDLAPRPLVIAVQLVLGVRAPQRELREDVVVSTDESVFLPQRPMPVALRGTVLLFPKPEHRVRALSLHPLDLMWLSSRVDRRIGIADTRVNVMRTDFPDSLNQVIGLLRFVLDNQNVHRYPIDHNLGQMERREPRLEELRRITSEQAGNVGLGPRPVAALMSCSEKSASSTPNTRKRGPRCSALARQSISWTRSPFSA